MRPVALAWTRSLGLGVALAGLVTLAGCTSSGSGSGSGSPAPSSTALLTAITPIPGSAASSPASSAPAPSTSASVTTTTITTSAPPKPRPVGPAGCTSAQLRVRVLRGGAVAGQEIALITFTNTDAVACSLFGFPGVSLRLHNALLGKAAERSGTPVAVTLKPGAQAEAQITDHSSCQAPVSDTVRVYPPNLRGFVDLPLALRGCRVEIAPVSHS